MTAILDRSTVAGGRTFGQSAGLFELALIAGCFAPLLISVPAQTPIRFASLLCWLPILYHYRMSLLGEARRMAMIFLMPAILSMTLLWTTDVARACATSA